VILVDTSALVDALCGPRRSGPRLRELVAAGERPLMTTLVLYEWLRGPRTERELRLASALSPEPAVVPFDAEAAEIAARLYRTVPRPRGRERDLAIAACALARGAALWTLNRADFEDVPDLPLS